MNYRYVLAALAAAASHLAWSQSSMNLLWMQRPQLMGSARYNGSAGALAALGGDGSSALENPALMNTSAFGGLEISGHFRHDQTSLSSQGLGIAQAYLSGAWRINSTTRMSVGIGYQHDAWNPNYWIDSERNPQTSAVTRWRDESTGFSPQQLLNSGRLDAYVAYMAYLTDVQAGGNYTAFAQGLPTLRQTQFVREYQTSSWSLPVAIRSGNFSLGLRLERRDGRAQEKLGLLESGFDPMGVTASYQKIVVDSTNWSQWSLRIGTALLLENGIRLSASLQPAPTASANWSYRNRVTPVATNPANNLTPFELYDAQRFTYQLPLQSQVGLAKVYGTRGVLSGVWTYTSSVRAAISAPLSYYELGRELASELRSHHQFRLGGELRLTESWTARGGLQWAQRGSIFDDHSRYQMIGLGLGYQERDWSFDMAYNGVRRSGSIQEPATQASWDLTAYHQRITATYRVRF